MVQPVSSTHSVYTKDRNVWDVGSPSLSVCTLISRLPTPDVFLAPCLLPRSLSVFFSPLRRTFCTTGLTHLLLLLKRSSTLLPVLRPVCPGSTTNQPPTHPLPVQFLPWFLRPNPLDHRALRVHLPQEGLKEVTDCVRT